MWEWVYATSAPISCFLVMESVSVLVPVYNVGKYIEQCVESLFAQTYRKIFYIFVDDCSKDNSRELLYNSLQRHPEKLNQVKIITHKYNKGVGATRQTALEAVQTEWLTFVDPDDYLPENAIRLLMEKALNTNMDIVEGAYQRVGYKHGNPILPDSYSDRQRLVSLLCHKGNGNLWGKLFRTRLFFDHNISFAYGVNYAEDFSVLPRLLLMGRRATIPQTVYYYRCDNPSSYSHHIGISSLLSQARAEVIVRDFFFEHDTRQRYRRPLLLGMLSIYRQLYRHGIHRQQLSDIDNVLDYESNYWVDQWFYCQFHTKYNHWWIYRLYSLYRKAFLAFYR